MADHDPSYKLLFSHRDLVADLIRGFVHEDWVEQLDFTTLQRVSEIGISHDLREREDDMIWRLRWGERWVYVYLLLEFQSSVDRFMAVRLLTYVGLLYQDLAAAGEIPAGDPLPPVLPIVLYNGEKSWWAKTSLDELIEPNLPAQLHRWQPQFRYLLLDEQRLADTALAGQRNIAAALFRLENSRRPEDIERVLASLIEWLAAPEQDSLRRAFVVWLKRVLLPARVPGAELPNVNDLQEMRAMLAERVKTWTEEWKQEGLKEGLEQGLSQGEARLLRRQLIRRFGALPAWAEAHLEQASEDELEVWADRVLECATLEEILKDPT
ncbi:Rpn family recombination-promoting nuclease/putative transposase [Thiorhodococcus mannitoliphagus]|uniref:Rpn family recombination-promoting nuclease/putative transposase n=1 Tax=Thiorhodococcus mannitoliphagus TaxID=329406 RepID=A0A6P1E5N1_9GAMM|nr:Rpn family recombination-promoting nuclease/putative transposase [Thiorhodococcus mannitoliphagus]NEX23334.1 Rpn family recombination-promoting nuclease/putative transposase [Thiorhodococcus mannitoliphagus]